jgi:HD-like signal output (HDOD) protein
MDDVARLISVDPSLSMKILRLSNSALFRFPSQIDSIAKAVSVIGGEALYNMVMAETANIAFKYFETDRVSLDEHWRNSIFCGMAAKYLAKQSSLRGSDRFFVIGILMNLSELVVAKRSPDLYDAYSADLSASLPWDKQLTNFGFTFAECSGIIMEKWKLPVPLYYPVKHLHQQTHPVSEIDIAILQCATRITLKENKRAKYGKLDIITPEMGKLVTLNEDVTQNASLFAQNETNKIATMII